MRIVQRVGRLYRYGQKKKVVVFNLNVPESMDGNVLDLNSPLLKYMLAYVKEPAFDGRMALLNDLELAK